MSNVSRGKAAIGNIEATGDYVLLLLGAWYQHMHKFDARAHGRTYRPMPPKLGAPDEPPMSLLIAPTICGMYNHLRINVSFLGTAWTEPR